MKLQQSNYHGFKDAILTREAISIKFKAWWTSAYHNKESGRTGYDDI